MRFEHYFKITVMEFLTALFFWIIVSIDYYYVSNLNYTLPLDEFVFFRTMYVLAKTSCSVFLGYWNLLTKCKQQLIAVLLVPICAINTNNQMRNNNKTVFITGVRNSILNSDSPLKRNRSMCSIL